MTGEPVHPRSFNFENLEQRQPGEGFVRAIHKPVGYNAAHDRELERLKKNPPRILPEHLRTLTLDRNTSAASLRVRPGAEPMAPVAGNGFEGIFQAGFIPGEPNQGLVPEVPSSPARLPRSSSSCRTTPGGAWGTAAPFPWATRRPSVATPHRA